ncbi:LysR substrate-binding domain-containing protein [uncultured Photobacterium sp.]|uniref:LysR substrate-binding domain-containing protein n=1 Tax=uncultured Photobacterium sp. TaxID=173973 RepID=UPI00260B5A3E|nr:LysR substrate-binding domain-containing protein [uncultured Photobacterium sp.]
MDHLPKLQQLKVLNEVIQCGSINGAAKKMNLSQPSLTYSLKMLEQTLGVTLLVRSNDGIQLTDAGKSFSAYSHLILEELKQAVNEAKQISSKSESQVSFGLSPIIAITILESIITDFKKKHPTPKISIKEGQLSSLLPALRDGRLDFAIGSLDENVPSCEFVTEHLFEAPFGIVARKGHPLANCKTLKQLKDAKWLLPETQMGYYNTLKKQFSNILPTGDQMPIFADSIVCIMNMVQNGDYLSVLSLARLNKNEYQNKYCVLPIEEALPVGNYSLVRLRKRPLSLAAQAMIDEIKWHASSYDWQINFDYPRNSALTN